MKFDDKLHTKEEYTRKYLTEETSFDKVWKPEYEAKKRMNGVASAEAFIGFCVE